jgi:hypothetical protein
MAAGIRVLAVLGLLIAPPMAVGQGEIQYIHDHVEVGVYPNADLHGETIAIVSTGTPLEELDRREDVVQVRIPSGKVGWVGATFLTQRKPAGVLLLEREAENQRLSQRLAQALDRVAELEAAARGQSDPVTPAMPGDPSETRLLRTRIEAAQSVLAGGEPIAVVPPSLLGRLPIWVSAAAGAFLLLLGLILGRAWRSHTVTDRGGIRVLVRR